MNTKSRCTIAKQNYNKNHQTLPLISYEASIFPAQSDLGNEEEMCGFTHHPTTSEKQYRFTSLLLKISLCFSDK